jgi:hypothetical protein
MSNEEMARGVESGSHVCHWNLGFGISLGFGIWTLDISVETTPETTVSLTRISSLEKRVVRHFETN